jgi:hypothetical protein
VRVEKEKLIDEKGDEFLRCGFRIGGGIDQDPRKSPHGYTDQVRGQRILLRYTNTHPVFLFSDTMSIP